MEACDAATMHGSAALDNTMSSNIKGGGRAILSSETQACLVDLLIDLKESTERATARPSSQKLSAHDGALRRKRFLQALVKRHGRQKLTAKYNCTTPSAPTHKSSTSTSSSNNSKNPSSKVRIELVEAIFPKHTKSTSSSKRTTTRKPWKAGTTRKTLVLSRATRVDQEDFRKLAQNKLRLKALPCCCFCVVGTQTVELHGDLSGLVDGTTLYVTTTLLETSQTTLRETDETIEETEERDETDEEDPLDAVKHAYATQERRQHQNTRADPPRITTLTTDSLPPLSPESASLPAADYREAFLNLVSQNRIVLVCGATGCGKSTQLPQYLVQGGASLVFVTQPRRVAATSLARRVAQECQSTPPGTPGSLVGHHVRLDRAVSETAQIVYCTTGILLRRLLAEDTLEHLSVLVIDEVHERDVNTDFLLTLLRSVLKRNSQLRVVLMSATAAADLFVDYFEAYRPVVLTIPGRSFPIQMHWLEDVERMAGCRLQTNFIQDATGIQESCRSSAEGPILAPRATEKIDNHLVANLMEAIVREQQANGDIEEGTEWRKSGAILAFLPGKAEIESLARVLYNSSLLGDQNVCNILKLHSAIPNSEQRKVFSCARVGTVKIVLATNIAETSITIPDVSHVIDSGRVKESRFNSSTRIKELVTVWTSQASGQQRAGRAGRTSAGVCWRLYKEDFFTSLPDQTAPEMIRTPLDELVLQMCLLYEQRRGATKSLGVSPVKFLQNAPEPPANESIENACEHLLEVGALVTVSDPEADALYRLTPLGYHLSHLPMDAKVGKVLIVGCILECVDEALTIAATLSCTKSCFLSSWGSSKDRQANIEARDQLVEGGFGGRNWKGGTVKGDLIAAIAVYRAWKDKKTGKQRATFCRDHALDHAAMNEIHSLRDQFKDCLIDGGFLNKGTSKYDDCNDDALLTSCCLVAGLYPNIATLMRPRKGGIRGGRLITNDGDICRPSSSSFQSSRVRQAAEKGKDAYAVFHAKHRSITTEDKRKPEVFLSEVNFISRYALLLFGGALQVEKNAIIVDGWLKFKVGEGREGAVLILELRKEIDKVMLRHMKADNNDKQQRECRKLIGVVRTLLAEEFSP